MLAERLPPQNHAPEEPSKKPERPRPRGLPKHKKDVLSKETPVIKSLTSQELAELSGQTIDDFKIGLEEKIKKLEKESSGEFAELKGQQVQEKNTEEAYNILNYLESPNRPDAGLLFLNDRLWSMLKNSDRLRAESKNYETNQIYVRERIAALDATVALIYEFTEKEKIFSFGKSLKTGIGRITKSGREQAKKIERVREWVRKAYAESRSMVNDLFEPNKKLTPEEIKILEDIETALNDIKEFGGV